VTRRADSASPTPPPSDSSDRREEPKRVLWRGILQTAEGPFPCVVLDLTLDGAKLALQHPLRRDQAVTLMLGALGTFRGAVLWEEGGTLGIRCEDDRARGR
jgi:hypothetical protein